MSVYAYTHPVLGEEKEAISGHYSLEKEFLLPFRGRQVWYYTGYSVVDTSCCGPGGCGFAFVAGYIVRLRHAKDATGADISDIEPIAREEERQELRKLLKTQSPVQQVNFWTPQTAAIKS